MAERERKLTAVEMAWLRGAEFAAQISESWGDECAGGSGQETVPSGPNKGQKYGQAYYNLAASIRRKATEQLHRPSK